MKLLLLSMLKPASGLVVGAGLSLVPMRAEAMELRMHQLEELQQLEKLERARRAEPPQLRERRREVPVEPGLKPKPAPERIPAEKK